eukprot:3938627-Rhodomonas_salina.4
MCARCTPQGSHQRLSRRCGTTPTDAPARWQDTTRNKLAFANSLPTTCSFRHGPRCCGLLGPVVLSRGGTGIRGQRAMSDPQPALPPQDRLRRLGARRYAPTRPIHALRYAPTGPSRYAPTDPAHYAATRLLRHPRYAPMRHRRRCAGLTA